MQNKQTEEQVLEILKQFRPEKSEILKALHALQNAHPLRYITEEAIKHTAHYFKLSTGQVFGIVTYYSMFSVKPRSPFIIRFCKSPVCYMKGSLNLCEYLVQKLQVNENKISNDGLFTLEPSECLGHCENAPTMMINEQVFTNLSYEKIDQIIDDFKRTYHEK